MITKGIIQTLDLLGNTCTVRMPLFETSGNDEITGTATISNTPGSYNGYKVGDVVWIAFEDGQMNTPVVIGKLYLGAEAERNDPRGVINVESSTVTKNAAVPADTKLTAQIDSNMPNTNLPYSSLYSVANELNSLKVSVAQNDREYGNIFKQTRASIDATGNTLRSELTQTANSINTTITSTKKELQDNIDGVQSNLNKAKETLTSTINQKANAITAEVAAAYVAQDGKSTSEAFGWSLKEDNWSIYKKENDTTTNVLYVDGTGLSVTGDITANSLTIKSGKSIEDELSEAKENAIAAAAEDATTKANNAKTAAVSDADTNVINKFDIVEIEDGKIKANKLVVESAQINDLVTDQLAVFTTDSNENKQPILLVNAKINSLGDPERDEGNVQIGGFNVSENTLSAEGKIQIKNSETGEEEEVDSKVSISTDAISVGPIDQTNNNVPLVISGTGEIIASKGSFSGQITASGAELKDTSYFSMASDGEAVFNTLNAATISVSDNISTKGRINSNSGYFFGPEADCGLSLEGTVQYIKQDCKISINASHMLVGGGTNNRYRITVSCKPAATKPIKITFSMAQWGSGINAITIAGGKLTINAGSTSASTQRTVTNTSKYQLRYTIDGVGGRVPAGGTNNPTSITTDPMITQIEVDGKILYSNSSGATSYPITIKQTTPSKSSNLKLDCQSFKMNGDIIIPNTATFKVKGNGDNNVVTLDNKGLQTDGAVKFKVGSDYYEPAIRLMTDGSPNCFWSKTFEIGGDGGSGWKAVTLPGELQDSSGSSGNNSKIIAILATGKFPKNVDNKDPDSGDAQGATFYTWWDGKKAYVYNPISRAPSTSVINIVVLGKL